ncbi:MAG: ABC transporter substrate-binding protein [Methanobacteriaceae archaeon]|nr:ABC transporter substrate-binding protein [Methanobacteriaceae archaeon]
MEKKTKIILAALVVIVIAAVAIVFLAPSTNVDTNGNVNITDMANRTVEVPANIEKVVSTRPSVTWLIYMLAPDKLAGINSEWRNNELEYIPDQYKNLPVVGQWNGKNDASYEEFMSVNPDVVIQDIRGDGSDLDVVEERQKNFADIPVVATLDTVELDKVSATITFLGKLLDAEDKADKLNSFNDKYLNIAKDTSSKIPDSEKKSVYFARSENGLNTAGPESSHAQLISIVGGKNVAEAAGANDKDFSVSIEEVVKWNPDVIISTDPDFYAKVYKDPSWASIKAVKNHEVYLAPSSPANWFDMPPGVNTIIGVPWTAKVIYPDKYTDIDLISATTEFYSEFYHIDLTNDQAKQILLDSGLKENIL